MRESRSDDAGDGDDSLNMGAVGGEKVLCLVCLFISTHFERALGWMFYKCTLKLTASVFRLGCLWCVESVSRVRYVSSRHRDCLRKLHHRAGYKVCTSASLCPFRVPHEYGSLL